MEQELIELVKETINESNDLPLYINNVFTYLDDEQTVRAIASACGIFLEIEPDHLAFETFVYRLLYYLELYPYHKGKLSVDDIIHMDRSTFNDLMRRHGIKDNLELLYQDRLVTIGELYKSNNI
jgi:hypothetical protein